MLLRALFQIVQIRQIKFNLTDQLVFEESFLFEPNYDFCCLKLGHALLEELEKDVGTEVAHGSRRDLLDFF